MLILCCKFWRAYQYHHIITLIICLAQYIMPHAVHCCTFHWKQPSSMEKSNIWDLNWGIVISDWKYMHSFNRRKCLPLQIAYIWKHGRNLSINAKRYIGLRNFHFWLKDVFPSIYCCTYLFTVQYSQARRLSYEELMYNCYKMCKLGKHTVT